jgi:glycosyltransferase involved in cell wall biosynthesis
MRIAIVHEWLTTFAGSEKVLAAMLEEFPEADLFCLFDTLTPEDRRKLGDRPIRTTALQRIPGMRRFYRALLPLMPLAIEQLDLSGYDVVISSSHAVAKGVITGPDQLHLCYCYSPPRYAWDLQAQYLEEAGLSRGARSLLARMLLHRMRIWDVRASFGVDRFVACSHYIARRIRKTYRRDAAVIHPGADTDAFVPGRGGREEFYLTASRMVPYKKIGLIVEAFARMPERRLVVIGAGPQEERIRAVAGPNVTLLGYQPFPVLLDHMQRAKAFIFAAEEDFGLAPVEAQACGTPVLAYGRGGACESVVDGVTGLQFHAQTTDAILEAVTRFEAAEGRFDPQRIRANALRFSGERFRAEFRHFVEAAMAERGERVGVAVPLHSLARRAV